MKIKQVSEHIWSLKTWLIIPIHVWVVVEKDGIILVDAGIGLMTKGILAFIDKLQAPLKAIVLTHGHSDHVGAVKGILKHHTAPVYAHPIEIPFIEGKSPYPGRKKAAEVLSEGMAKPLQEDSLGELALIGGLRPYLSPGHSPGHVVYYHEQDQVMLAGDLFTSKKGQLRKPMKMFTHDMKEAIASSVIVRKLQPKRLEVCHGDSVLFPGHQIDAYLAGK